MTESILTLSLSESVTGKLLPDIEALLPAADYSVLLDILTDQPQATVQCSQTQDVCSLLAAAIMTWLRLSDICLWLDSTPLNAETLTLESLFVLLMEPHAHLRLAGC